MMSSLKEKMIDRYSLRMRKLENESKGLDESDEDKGEDAKVSYPLMPNDPSAGFIEVQGHYIVHFAFFIALQLFVDFRGEKFCFDRSKTGTWTKASDAKVAEYDMNTIATFLKWMHLVIGIFQMVGMFAPPRKLSVNLHILKKLLVFVCAPVYIFAILKAQYDIFFDRVWYKAGSTKTAFTLAYPLCVNQSEGNVYEWLLVEIYAFYTNFLVLVVLLAVSRCSGSQETHLEMDLDELQNEAEDLFDDAVDSISTLRLKVLAVGQEAGGEACHAPKDGKKI